MSFFGRLRSFVGPNAGRLPRIPAFLYWSPIVLAGLNYFYNVKLITGRSMQPTLNPDTSLWRDLGLFDKITIRTSHQSYQRGDIVAIISPENPHFMLVKRVLAIGGDIVQTLPPYPEPEVKVPEGHVWVEGDDSFHTDDSNRLGPIPSALIDSKLVCILWPLDRFGPVTVPDSHSLESINPADSRTKRRVMDAIQRAEWRKSRVLRRGGPHSD